MSREAFWERVDDLLDRRRDPLGDPTVRAHLREHPAARAELRRLLGILERLPRSRPRRARRLAVAAAAAVLLVAASAGALSWIGGEGRALSVAGSAPGADSRNVGLFAASAPEPAVALLPHSRPPEPGFPSDPASGSRILSFAVRVSVEDGAGRRARSIARDGDGRLRERFEAFQARTFLLAETWISDRNHGMP